VRGRRRRDAAVADLGPAVLAAQIVSYASQAITLRPGDLIATGTCGGVGDARKPPVYLQPGNLLRTWIEGLGECLNQCVPEKAD
jgi:acylpyruvate hydrolase